MMTEAELQEAASALDGVASTRQMVPLFSRAHPAMTLTDSYAIQRHWSELRVTRGDPRIGYKIGLTSRAMQTSLKVDSPQIGRLHASHLFREGARIDASRYLKPRLEVEIAFIMGADVTGKSIQPHDIVAATAFLQPALELVDYRTETPRLVTDMVADNTAAAAAILGGRIVRPTDVDIRWISATLSKNGVIEESGVSAAILGHPANAVAILANKLVAEGQHLRAGDIVLAGSFTRQIDVTAGDVVHADYGPLSSFAVSFA
jgi:2-oxo-hept-3-ene-1,7-dioate hydratase